MGVTAETIANGEDGKVLWFGRIRGINTNAYNEGDILYASTSVAGGFQTTLPVAPNNIVEVCAVVTKSVNNGVIFVRPQFLSSGSKWTDVGLGNIYRNSKISVGHLADPTESIDLGDAGWLKTGRGASNAGGIVLPYTTANASSRGWTIRNDAGGFGELGFTVANTQTGDPKSGTLKLRITPFSNIGVNGTPDSFGNYAYLSLYGLSTTQGGVFIAKTSDNSHSFQLRVDSTANHLQALNNPMIFYCGTGGAERMRITNGGNLLLGTTTDLGYRFYSVGTTGLDGNITLIDTSGTNIIFGTTTGSKIGTATSQKLAFWNATPIVQPTTGVSESAFVENAGGTAVNDDSTFDGYTLRQVVKALRDAGLLA
jgi:hypothetical protein